MLAAKPPTRPSLARAAASLARAAASLARAAASLARAAPSLARAVLKPLSSDFRYRPPTACLQSAKRWSSVTEERRGRLPKVNRR